MKGTDWFTNAVIGGVPARMGLVGGLFTGPAIEGEARLDAEQVVRVRIAGPVPDVCVHFAAIDVLTQRILQLGCWDQLDSDLGPRGYQVVADGLFLQEFLPDVHREDELRALRDGSLFAIRVGEIECSVGLPVPSSGAVRPPGVVPGPVQERVRRADIERQVRAGIGWRIVPPLWSDRGHERVAPDPVASVDRL